MRPPQRPKLNYEKVIVGEMIPGTIEKVEYDNEHKFKGFQGGDDTIQPAVRLKFKLNGYSFQHYSRWMKFTLSEKSNLFKKYVSKLVTNAVPDMDIDLDALNGMKIKTVWSEENDFQNIDAIYPDGAKVNAESFVSEGPEDWVPPDEN